MKALANGLAMLVVFAASATAQTNWITAHPDFRVVDGQLYNVAKSRKWTGDKQLEIFKLGPTNGWVFAYDISEYDAPRPLTDGERIVREMRRPVFIPGVSTGSLPPGPPLHRVRQTNGVALVGKTTKLVGETITAPVFIRGETNIDGRRVAIYDLGEPHRVPVLAK